MRNPLALALRSIALATALLVASFGTIHAHAGEPHADAPGGWSAIGWLGLATLLAVFATLWLVSQDRPDDIDFQRPSAAPFGKIADDRPFPPA